MAARWIACVGLGLVSLAALAGPREDELRRDAVEPAVAQWRAAILKERELNPDPAASWRALDARVDPITGPALFMRPGPSSAAELADHTAWLRWRVLARNADGRYSYAYASNLLRTSTAARNLEMESAIFLAHARLSLWIDAARCTDDAGALERATRHYEPQGAMKPVIDNYDKLQGRRKAHVLLEAVAIEEALGERTRQVGLCRSDADWRDDDEKIWRNARAIIIGVYVTQAAQAWGP